jgi:hypothetical protein
MAAGSILKAWQEVLSGTTLVLSGPTWAYSLALFGFVRSYLGFCPAGLEILSATTLIQGVGNEKGAPRGAHNNHKVKLGESIK